MIARIIVQNKPYIVPFLSPAIIEWWPHVSVAPDDNKITVLSKGISNGLRIDIPLGGHTAPNSTVGDKLEWKKAQKIERKKNISEITNKINPIEIPLWTILVWKPWYV